jgi:hypothetical protein
MTVGCGISHTITKTQTEATGQQDQQHTCATVHVPASFYAHKSGYIVCFSSKIISVIKSGMMMCTVHVTP